MKKVILILTLVILFSTGCSQNQQTTTPPADIASNNSNEEQKGQHPNWQKQCSEKLNFEIQYPQDWISDIGFISDTVVGYQFSTLPKNKKLEKRSYFNIFTINEDMAINASEIKEEKSIKFLEYNAIQYTFKNNNKRIVFKKDDTFFHIIIDEIIKENEIILDDILSSFRFLSNNEGCHEINKPGTIILGDKIYYYGTEIGSFNNGRISISFQENTYSFLGNPEHLSKMNVGNIEDVYYYKKLSINLPNTNHKESPILYECSSPLLPSRPYFYCNTNEKDYLTQYEFGKDYRQFSTGGGFPLEWKKIHIKNINNKNIIFEGVLDGDTSDSTDQKDIQKIKSKNYLDEIKQSSINKENEKMWESLVQSFSIEK
jgi:hypothetical protein